MTMQINRQALRSIIPDETRLLFAEQISPEYQSDALGRARHRHFQASVFPA